MRGGSNHQTADLFSTSSVGESSAPATKQLSPVHQRRHILPKDLANAVKHLADDELDLLIAACREEGKRRGRLPASDRPCQVRRDETSQRIRRRQKWRRSR